MGILTPEMQKLVREQRLGFIATVCPDGTPNLSPKGSTTVWDDDHLVFADVTSPRTIRNLVENPRVEINVVDPLLRKGFRFKGSAEVLRKGPTFEEVLAHYGTESSNVQRIRAVVLVTVQVALPIHSPAYDLGASESQVRRSWEEYWRSIRAGGKPKLPILDL
jgi:uncharacterized protein